MRTLLAALLVPLAIVAATPATTAEAAPAAPARAGSGTFALSTGSVGAGAKVTATGTFKKAYAHRKVLVQVADGRTWVPLAKGKANAAGKYSINLTAPATPGTVKLRAYVASFGAKAKATPAAMSAPKALKVVRTGPGTSTDPLPVGSTVAQGAWSITFGATDTDAWPEIAAVDEENEAPAAGWSYVMVPVTFRNTSGASADPYMTNDIGFLGSDREEYDDESGDQWCGVLPNDWSDLDELPAGAVVTANVCAVVPTSAVTGGAWYLQNEDADEPVYFKIG
jgi:hypothetical protein